MWRNKTGSAAGGAVTRLTHAARATPLDEVDNEGAATHRVQHEECDEGTWLRFWGWGLVVCRVRTQFKVLGA